MNKYSLEILWKPLGWNTHTRKRTEISREFPCVRKAFEIRCSELRSPKADCERKSSEKLIEDRLKRCKNKTQPISRRHLRWFKIISALSADNHLPHSSDLLSLLKVPKAGCLGYQVGSLTTENIENV